MAFTNVWQPLTHDKIINCAEEITQTKLSNFLLRRNSYINRVFELEKFDSRERLIIKFYRPSRWPKEMILEEHQLLRELFEQEISVVPAQEFNKQTLFSLDNIFCAVFPKQSGWPLDEFNQAAWEEIGRLLARIHLMGARHKASQRITWRPAMATKQHLQTLLQSNFLLPDYKKTFHAAAEEFIGKTDFLFNKHEFILLHGDCHKGNLIHRPNESIFLVDFDDICFGPPMQDIWMLFPGPVQNFQNELTWFKKGYDVFSKLDQSALELIPALRAMRLIHFAAWLSVQSSEHDFNGLFPEAGSARYWNELIKELQEISLNA
jgi:Ser/Thr protein kinase RdoA (MazF antagonist)